MMPPATTPIDRLLDYTHSRLVAVFDTCPTREALDALADAGFAQSFDVHCGHDGARLIDFSGTEHGVLAQMSHALRHMTDEGDLMHGYERALSEGHCVVMVLTPDSDTRQLADGILRAHGGHFMNHFGIWTAETV